MRLAWPGAVVALVMLAALVAAAWVSVLTRPSGPTGYAVGGGTFSTWAFLVVARCSEPPRTQLDVELRCDPESLALVRVAPEAYPDYGMGVPYPLPAGPTPSYVE